MHFDSWISWQPMSGARPETRRPPSRSVAARISGPWSQPALRQGEWRLGRQMASPPKESISPMAAETGEMSVPMVILSGTLGALLGALINYALSYFLGRPIVYAFANSRFGHMCLINQRKVEQAEQYFDRHGAISTLIGRMIPAIRQLISIPAGLARMNLLSFVLYTTLGAALWNGILVAIGYACHTQVDKATLIQTISHYSHIIGYTCIALLIGIIAFLIYQGTRRKQDV